MKAAFYRLLAITAVLVLSGCALWPFSSQETINGPYKDIPIPEEMSVDQDSINVYETAEGRLGFVKAEGRIKSAAVIYYYREAMTQNGWQLDSEFDSGDKRHMMVFRKQNRSAVITIIEGWVFTKLEVNVNRNKHK